MVILAMLPGVILMVRTGLNQRSEAIQAAEIEVSHLGHVASTTQNVMIDAMKGFLQTIAHMPSIRDGDMTECQTSIAHIVTEHYNYYSSFYVSDLVGNVLCSPPGLHAPPNFEECDHYKNLVKASDFTYSGYHICKNTGKAVLSIGLPIYDLQENHVMVTNVSLDLIWFYDFAVDAELPEGSELIVMDNQGTILAHYPDNETWRGESALEFRPLTELYVQKGGSLTGKGPLGVESIYALTTIYVGDQELYVVLGMPTSIAFADANTTMKRDLVLLLVVTALAIGFMWMLGDALIVKQAKVLVETTERLAKGDLTVRTGMNYRVGELGQLAEAFDVLAEELAFREDERNRNVQELNEYARNLELTNQELRDFTNIASHDLQEPLRKIQTFGELLVERYGSGLDERGADYLQRMQYAARRMRSLIDELLAYSRLTTKAQPFCKVDMHEVVQDVLADLDWQIEHTQAKVSVSNTLPVIEADPLQMYQLVQNLVGNALKFTCKDCAPVVRVDGSTNGAYINGVEQCEIIVEDEGIGFDNKYRERIFQPFQRLEGIKEYEGTGMGLAICRKIVERHGGSIEARSSPGKGATFTVRLPVVQPDEKAGRA
jgi:signal transduction histidine kinase